MIKKVSIVVTVNKRILKYVQINDDDTMMMMKQNHNDNFKN